MYAVIFRARVAKLDTQYIKWAEELRSRAAEYGCVDFVSVAEGSQEVAISYWPNMDAIEAWKADTMHLKAQARGKEKWYEDYQVEVVKVIRSYNKEKTR